MRSKLIPYLNVDGGQLDHDGLAVLHAWRPAAVVLNGSFGLPAPEGTLQLLTYGDTPSWTIGDALKLDPYETAARDLEAWLAAVGELPADGYFCPPAPDFPTNGEVRVGKYVSWHASYLAGWAKALRRVSATAIPVLGIWGRRQPSVAYWRYYTEALQACREHNGVLALACKGVDDDGEGDGLIRYMADRAQWTLLGFPTVRALLLLELEPGDVDPAWVLGVNEALQADAHLLGAVLPLHNLRGALAEAIASSEAGENPAPVYVTPAEQALVAPIKDHPEEPVLPQLPNSEPAAAAEPAATDTASPAPSEVPLDHTASPNQPATAIPPRKTARKKAASD